MGGRHRTETLNDDDFTCQENPAAAAGDSKGAQSLWRARAEPAVTPTHFSPEHHNANPRRGRRTMRGRAGNFICSVISFGLSRARLSGRLFASQRQKQPAQNMFLRRALQPQPLHQSPDMGAGLALLGPGLVLRGRSVAHQADKLAHLQAQSLLHLLVGSLRTHQIIA